MTKDDDRSSYELMRLLAALAVAFMVVVAIEVRESPPDPIAVASLVASAENAATTTVVPQPASFSIAVTGEILPHPSIVDYAARFGSASGRPYDFAPIFADLAPVLKGTDLAICHLEVPVAPPGTELSGYPAFGIPADIGDGIAETGWDRCSTASNHTNDRGTAGIRATLDALDASNVGHSGTARTADEAAALPIVDVRGVPVAHFSYTWGFNGTAPAESWMSDVIDPARILADAAAARAQGAQVVVVSLHWGVEYDTAGSGEQRQLADQLLSSPDVDLIIGHGPHVIQPIVEMHRKYALLSVGNLVANQGRERPRTYDGTIVTFTFERDAAGNYVAAAPHADATWYDRDAGRVRLVSTALGTGIPNWLRDSLSDSRDRTAQVLGPLASVD